MNQFLSVRMLIEGVTLNLALPCRVRFDALRGRFNPSLGILLLFASLSVVVAGQDYEPCREDFDGNYVIGVEDQETLTDCLTGPGVNNKDINCVQADFDRDHHIDLRDLAKLTPKSGPCHLCAMEWAEE